MKLFWVNKHRLSTLFDKLDDLILKLVSQKENFTFQLLNKNIQQFKWDILEANPDNPILLPNYRIVHQRTIAKDNVLKFLEYKSSLKWTF